MPTDPCCIHHEALREVLHDGTGSCDIRYLKCPSCHERQPDHMPDCRIARALAAPCAAPVFVRCSYLGADCQHEAELCRAHAQVEVEIALRKSHPHPPP